MTIHGQIYTIPVQAALRSRECNVYDKLAINTTTSMPLII